MMLRALVLSVAVGLAAAQSVAPQISAIGQNIQVNAAQFTIHQNDGQTISSSDLLQMQSQLQTAISEIGRLSGLVDTLSANLSSVSAARDSAIAALNTSFDTQLGAAAAAAVDARLDAVPEYTGIPNMVHGADLSDVSDWLQGSFATDRVPFSATFDEAAPTMIKAIRIDELEHSNDDDDLDHCYGSHPQTNAMPVSPNNTYTTGAWIKSNGHDIDNYFGFYVYDADMNQIGSNDGTNPWYNPYFKAGSAESMGSETVDQWRHHKGILRAADSPGEVTQVSIDGGRDYKLPPNAAFVTLRFRVCYGNGDAQGSTWIAFPRMNQLLPGIVSGSAMAETRLGKNLIDSPDFSNTNSWKVANFSVERTEWNDGAMITANVVRESAHETGASICYNTIAGRRGFAQTNYIRIDPYAKYDVGLWIKSTGLDLNNYLGFFVFDGNLTQIIRCEDGTECWQNPYFRTSQRDKPYFVYHSGTIWPTDTNMSHARSGNRETTSEHDWKFPPNAQFMVLRWGTCYGDGDGTGVSHFVYPEVKQVFKSQIYGQGLLPPGGGGMKAVAQLNIGVGPDGFAETVGVRGTNPSPWMSVNAGSGMHLDTEEYREYVANDGTQDLVGRFCFSYSDTGGASSNGLLFRLQRIQRGGEPTYGSAGGFDAGHVFWQGRFPRTWSGASLFHHRCGAWFLLDELSCGYRWTDTCEIQVQSTSGGELIKVDELSLEMAVRMRI